MNWFYSRLWNWVMLAWTFFYKVVSLDIIWCLPQSLKINILYHQIDYNHMFPNFISGTYCFLYSFLGSIIIWFLLIVFFSFAFFSDTFFREFSQILNPIMIRLNLSRMTIYIYIYACMFLWIYRIFTGIHLLILSYCLNT